MDVGDPSSTTFADFSKPAATWMHPMRALHARDVVEIPGDWDRTDFCWANFVPMAPNSQYVLRYFLYPPPILPSHESWICARGMAA